VAKAKPTTTKAGAGSLAFTGTGPALFWLGFVGVLLMLLGGFVLFMSEGPRRLLRPAAINDSPGRDRRAG
jgi:hypothetical protein